MQVENKETFEKAKNNGWYLIFSGDSGGDYYLSYPANKIRCDFQTLERLLYKMDFWDKETAQIEFSESPLEQTTDELWISNNFINKRKQILKVLHGKRKNIGLDLKTVFSFIVNFPKYVKLFLLVNKGLKKQDKNRRENK